MNYNQNMANKNKGTFLFLSIPSVIKSSRLLKKDVAKVKDSLAKKMSVTGIFIAVGFAIINLALFIVMGLNTNWNNLSAYGLESVLGQIFGFVFSIVSVVLTLFSIKSSSGRRKNTYARLSTIVLFVAIELQLLLSFVADSKAGFLSGFETLSPSIIAIALLLVVQPAYWVDAIVLDGTVSIGVLIMAIVNTVIYKIQALHYYIFVSVFFPFVSYIIISVLFYAEAQRYCEVLRNEALNNTAMYDELTHCKNRHALRGFLKENASRWNNKGVKLLIIMFDIDNFKLYNDQFSHPGGDYCLKTIAEAIRKEFPAPGLDFFRYGGEEFLLFFELNDFDQASEYMERVRNCVKNTKIVAPSGAPEDVVTISVGGSVIETQNHFDFDESLKVVDSYLYQAKRSGKNICVIDGNKI